MRITEIRVKLIDGDESRQRLRAFCTLAFDNAFVVRDLKILEGSQGYFVAMPSRKLTIRCPGCRQKNSVGSNYCSQCGCDLRRLNNYSNTPPYKLYVDIVHPINASARDVIHRAIIDAYEQEKIRAQEPGYVSSFDDYSSDYEP
ncbi:MAG: SpoVG family protein [Thermoguttaceae bacterium]|jgi:stage V sporulation protein G|nr:SpoVG family protein [Thermoguttaceae bacterium]